MTMLKKEDIVRVTGSRNYPGLWKVVKVNPTTYGLESLTGLGRLRASHSYVVLADAHGFNEYLPQLPALEPGMVVRTASHRLPGLWVVIKTGRDKVNIARLGGQQGKYWRIVPGSLTEVPLEELGDALLREKVSA